jgi:hypothetical protein
MTALISLLVCALIIFYLRRIGKKKVPYSPDPVFNTVTCPECQGSRMAARLEGDSYVLDYCGTCAGTGKTTRVIRPPDVV